MQFTCNTHARNTHARNTRNIRILATHATRSIHASHALHLQHTQHTQHTPHTQHTEHTQHTHIHTHTLQTVSDLCAHMHAHTHTHAHARTCTLDVLFACITDCVVCLPCVFVAMRTLMMVRRNDMIYYHVHSPVLVAARNSDGAVVQLTMLYLDIM